MNYLVIPAYEPDEHLVQLLTDMSGTRIFTILVVNDGSPEKYDEIFESVDRKSVV